MTDYAWHVHHEILLEPLTEPIEVRQQYIREHKPPSEQELRLRLFQPVRGQLPEAYTEARKAQNEAWKAQDAAGRAWNEAGGAEKAEAEAEYDAAWRAYGEAWKAYDEAVKAYLPEIEALHALECPDCPWDGKTIFPGQEVTT